MLHNVWSILLITFIQRDKIFILRKIVFAKVRKPASSLNYLLFFFMFFVVLGFCDNVLN